jgi:hypothetical protein
MRGVWFCGRRRTRAICTTGCPHLHVDNDHLSVLAERSGVASIPRVARQTESPEDHGLTGNQFSFSLAKQLK